MYSSFPTTFLCVPQLVSLLRHHPQHVSQYVVFVLQQVFLSSQGVESLLKVVAVCCLNFYAIL